MPNTTLTPKQLDEVRTQVRGLLSRTASFAELPPQERDKLASGMVQVLSFLADPTAGQGGDATPDDNAELLRLVSAQAKSKSPPKSTTAGDLLNPAASKEAGARFEQLTGAVDFPAFVSGLVEGVFTSIVDSTIRQMQEYGKLLEAVVKSVNEFKNEHITPQDAREHVIDRFPDAFQFGQGDEGMGFDEGAVGEGFPRLSLREGIDDDSMPDLKSAFGLDEDLDISDPEGENKLVESVRLQMARLRQQQLATMMLLGINRIIVTDGFINAKVFIDVRSRDRVERTNLGQSSSSSTGYSAHSGRDIWNTSRGANVQTTVTSAYAQAKDKSESEIKTRASLTGEVRINFRSETFPLDRIGSPAELTSLNDKAARR
ncbi:hypothetical protein [Haliangium sp.]|uniref:hypothetical protein n=1 Tax=Haliangium sp. TaxID=2663208 RepID=UPI003D0D8807